MAEKKFEPLNTPIISRESGYARCEYDIRKYVIENDEILLYLSIGGSPLHRHVYAIKRRGPDLSGAAGKP